MSLFAIADLHLSFNTNKPMDIFSGWEDYCTKLQKNWNKIVNSEDTVVICGDISWAMNLDELNNDFKFIDELNGSKIILKGNHDYWWTTLKKMNGYVKENSFTSIKFLHNNAYIADNKAICGTRGWILESVSNTDEDKKIILRECQRLETSIKEGLKYNLPLYIFLHYPPVVEGFECKEIIEILIKYKIKNCFYGHIHGASSKKAVIGEYNGIDFRLISSDYVDFTPILA